MNAESSFKPLTLGQRTALFVDVQHLFYAGKNIHQCKIDYGKLIRGLSTDRQMIRAIAYVVQRSDVNQAAFYGSLINCGYEIRSREVKAQPNSDGTTSFPRVSWSVGIAIDAVRLAP